MSYAIITLMFSNLLRNEKTSIFIILATLLTLFFANIIFFNRTVSTASLTMGVMSNGPYNYPGPRIHTLPVIDGAASAWHYNPIVFANYFNFQKGSPPLWNPYLAAGEPLAADMQSSGFFPPQLPLLVYPSPFVWDLYLVFRLLIAGFFTYLFMRLLKVNKSGSILAATAYMFSGYLIMFMNMAHLNVEILIPLLFYCLERLIKKVDLLSAFLLAISIALSILGGMPESTFLAFIFLLAYAIFRLIGLYSSAKVNAKRGFFYCLLAAFMGTMFSFVLLLPFFEYFKLAWHGHGLRGLDSYNIKYAIQTIIPRFFGVSNTWFKISEGNLPVYLATIALFLGLAIKKKHSVKYFFALSASLLLLKIFGVWPVQLVGLLPLFKSVIFAKYGQAEVAFFIAVLGGLALDNLKEINFKRIAAVIGLWMAAAGYFILLYKKEAVIYKTTIYIISHSAYVLAILILATLVLAAYRFKKISFKITALLIITLSLAQLYQAIPKIRPRRYYPYVAPPFVEFIKKDRSAYRTFSVSPVLFPDTNVPLRLEDARSNNALHLQRYMDYVGQFSDLRSKGHVNGLEALNLDSPFFDLLNIKYLITTEDLRNNLNKLIKKANPWLTEGEITLDAEKKNGFLVDDTRPFSFSTKSLPKDCLYLNFSVGSTSDKKANLSVLANGSTILSKDILSNERWHNLKIDVKKYRGKEVTFVFLSDARLLWTNFRLGSADNLEKFKLVYNSPQLVYENKKMFPRVFAVQEVLSEKTDRVLSKMGKIDLRSTAVVEEPVTFKSKTKPLVAIKGTKQDLDAYKFKINSNQRAFVVVTNANYPGFNVYINSRRAKLYQANYLFQGFFVNKGESDVKISYEPATFKTGAWISSLAFIVFSGIVVFDRKRRART